MTLPSAASPAVPLRTLVHCPKCGSNRIHRSRRRSTVDRILAGLGAQLRRCHDCRTRQAWFGVHPLPLSDANSAMAKLTDFSLIGSGLLACLLVAWWVVSRIKAGGG